ncbi:MAG: hypothetical protein DRR08_21270 [Candidatus Parabeggiatoa sp. nov. 2]|nr:MAG: hypothetical protein DRR08_21270 [Gammaproteobacteria bacterium]
MDFQKTFQTLLYLFGLSLGLVPTAATAATDTPILRIETGMHTAAIPRIDVDAQERYLVTGSEDKTVRVWSLPNGKLLRVLRPPIGEGYEGQIYAVAISPDGKTVAAGGRTGKNNFSVYLFDRATGELRQRLQQPSTIVHLNYSADGRYLVACLWDDGIRIYRRSDYRLHAQDTDYGNISRWAEFDNAGRLVTTSDEGYIRLYNKDFKLLHKRLVPGGKQPVAARFSPDGMKVAVGFGDSTQINVLSSDNLDLLYSPDTQGVDNGNLASVAWSSDGHRLYAGGEYNDKKSRPILRWSQAGRGRYQAWSASDNSVMDIRALQNGKILFAASDPVFGLFNANGEKTLYREAVIADFRDNEKGLLLSKDGRTVQFGFESGGKHPARFSVTERTLSLIPPPLPFLKEKRLPFQKKERTRPFNLPPSPFETGRRPPFQKPERTRPFNRPRSPFETGRRPPFQQKERTGPFNLPPSPFNKEEGSPPFKKGKNAVRSFFKGRLNLIAPRTQAPGLNITGWKQDYPKLNGKPLSLRQGERSRSLAIAPDGEHFLLGCDWSLQYFDKQGQPRWKIPVQGVVWAVNIAGNGKVGVAAFGDGTIHWYRLRDGQELLVFFPAKPALLRMIAKRRRSLEEIVSSLPAPDKLFSSSNRWILGTKDGYYDTSVGGEELIGWHLNRGAEKAADFYNAAQFRDIYYRPDVIAKVLETLDVQETVRLANQEKGLLDSKTTLVDILPPVVELLPLDETGNNTFSSSQVQLRYKVRPNSKEPITALTVLLNGRPLPEAYLKGLPKNLDYQADNIYSLTVLLPTEEVTISLLAENRYTTSEPSSLKLHWKEEVAERGRSSGKKRRYSTRRSTALTKTLYVLAIGVSQYDDPSVQDLNYPAKDAKDFVKLLKKQRGKGLYDGIKTRLYSNATFKDILKGLEWIKKQTQRQDTAMIFLAGHGFNDEGGEYYFFPKDGQVKHIFSTALPYFQLKHSMATINGKVLFFVDTCYSGNLTAGNLRLPDMTGLTNKLASAKSGVVVYAASAGNQSSVEYRGWQNGAFTEALLEGLSGKAGYGEISFLKLGTYLAERVPELVEEVAKKYGKQLQQTPTFATPQAMPAFAIVKVR